MLMSVRLQRAQEEVVFVDNKKCRSIDLGVMDWRGAGGSDEVRGLVRLLEGPPMWNAQDLWSCAQPGEGEGGTQIH
jgi:hypothetical protein